MKKYAKDSWKGNGLGGSGMVELQSECMIGANYTFNSRFNNSPGTNSEELLAAAHASDFTMKLSYILTEAGFVPLELNTTCFVDFDKGELVSSTLNVAAKITGIKLCVFNNFVKEANENCPISNALCIRVSIETTICPSKKKDVKLATALSQGVMPLQKINKTLLSRFKPKRLS